jgi:hypothetical protein
MIRTLCFTFLFLAGCSLPETPLPADIPIGTTVIIKADGREGTVISSFPSTRKPSYTEWLVKIEDPNPRAGVKFQTEAFFHHELKAQP